MAENYQIDAFYQEFEAKFQEFLERLSKCKPELAERAQARKYSLFNQDPRTTLKKGRYYFIGLNPGGADGCSYPDENLEFWKSKPLGYSGFFDEFWQSEENKTPSPHQKRTQELLCALAGDKEGETEKARQVFSTNAYFYRSHGEDDLKEYGQGRSLDLINCGDFHRKFLEIVKPNVIICNGCNPDFSAFSLMTGCCTGRQKETAMPEDLKQEMSE